MNLGDRIRQARSARHLTVSQLGVASGLSKGFISQVESGRANPSIGSLERIAAALQVPLHDLLVQGPTTGFTPAPPGIGPRVHHLQTPAPTASTLEKVGTFRNNTEFVRASLLPGSVLLSPALAIDSGVPSVGFGVVVDGEAHIIQSPVHSSVSQGEAFTLDAARRYQVENRGLLPCVFYITFVGEVALPILLETGDIGRLHGRPGPLVEYADKGPLRLAAMRSHRTDRKVR